MSVVCTVHATMPAMSASRTATEVSKQLSDHSLQIALLSFRHCCSPRPGPLLSYSPDVMCACLPS